MRLPNKLRNTILQGEAVRKLAELPDESVHCIITSPPYWNLRDYGDESQIGLETTPESYVRRLCDTLSASMRVLRNDGALWLNLGDTYATAKHGNDDPKYKQANTKTFRKRTPENCKPKDLVGIPWLVAFECRKRGWYLRRDIIWHKPNSFPESVHDRPHTAHEYIFMLTKSKKYYYDAIAVREGNHHLRSVWSVNIANFSRAHFATFPHDLIVPCIKASTSEHGVCAACGQPWQRVWENTDEFQSVRGKGYDTYNETKEGVAKGRRSINALKAKKLYKTTGWEPDCNCDAGTEPAVVLDMFMGAGTTAYISKRLGRHYVGTELKHEYIGIANERLNQIELFN